MPLTAAEQHLAQHLCLVSHDAVDAKVKQVSHHLAVVHGPGVHLQACRMRPVHEPAGRHGEGI